MSAFTDNFTGTSGDTLESRTGWTRVGGAAGACQINGSNQLGYPAAVADTLYRPPDTGSADHYGQADTAYAASLAAFCFPICVRATDASNYIGFRLRNTGTTMRNISKDVAGTFTVIASDNTDPGNGTYKLKASGNTITLDFNGVNVFTVTESAFNTITFPGIAVRASPAIPAMIDNWQSDVNSVAVVVLPPDLFMQVAA